MIGSNKAVSCSRCDTRLHSNESKMKKLCVSCERTKKKNKEYTEEEITHKIKKNYLLMSDRKLAIKIGINHSKVARIRIKNGWYKNP